MNQISGLPWTPARCIASRKSGISKSSPSPGQLAQWRVFIECAFALIDILDAELQAERELTLDWYDALVHLEDATDGLSIPGSPIES